MVVVMLLYDLSMVELLHWEIPIIVTGNGFAVYNNSLARHFSPMFHTRCLIPMLDRLLPVRSCLKYFYQCSSFVSTLTKIP